METGTGTNTGIGTNTGTGTGTGTGTETKPGTETDTEPGTDTEEVPPVKVMGKEEALQALIDGKTSTIKHRAADGETVNDIAEKYKEDEITAEAIIAENKENEGLTADGKELTADAKLEEGAEVKVTVTRPYLHVVISWIGEVIEEVDYGTERNKSDEVTLHTTKVQQEGEKGSRSLSYDIISRNGVVVENGFRGENMIKEPVTEIVLEGTKPKVVNLSGSEITDSRLAEMVRNGDIPGDVTTLYLNGNEITDISPLKSLTGLTELYLNSNNINNLSSLQSLNRLTVLSLNDNRSISDLSPLKSLNNLQNLDVSYNNISDFSPLKSLSRLRMLDISNNIKGVGNINRVVEDLKKALPDCTIKCTLPNE